MYNGVSKLWRFMCNRSTDSALIAFLMLSSILQVAYPQTDWKILHNADNYLNFDSPTAIEQFFAAKDVRIKTFQIAIHKKDIFCLAAYPYSGSDTIDFFCFRRHGAKWRIQMLYFALNPRTRDLTLLETNQQIVLKDGDRELITITAASAK